MEGLKRFLSVNYSDGSGYGCDGYGDGSGSGSGDDCDGSGDGDGSGSGFGFGFGSGSGSGSGYGDGDGYGLKSYCGEDVHYVDGLPTVITSLKGSIAKGYIINNDLTTKNVYIAKVGNSFAHGKTIKKAVSDAQAKHLQDSPVEDRIEEFHKQFSELDKIPAKDLFDWHFVLTGSCEIGREQFVRQRGIDLKKDSFTVDEFIELTKDSYGGDVIKQLK